MADSNLGKTRTLYYDLMINSINSLCQTDIEDNITGVLGIIGEFISASRVYVFENDAEHQITKNTYEWCAEGIEPQISQLQSVPYSAAGNWLDMLREDGIIKVDNLRKLSNELYDRLNVQGILSLLVLPLYNGSRLIGFVGFDECREYRHWNDDEIKVLTSLSNLVMNLITRRNAEQEASTYRRVMRTVLDNIETPIFVTDPETSTILFANRKFTDELSCGEAEGKLCREVAFGENGGECEFCPRRLLMEMEPGTIYNWETYKDQTGKWYYCTDRLIKWGDDKTVHLHSALDITSRKEYEGYLKFNATYDKMTGVFNRESGLKYLDELMKTGKHEDFPITFCFLDIDDLKHVNDTLGHLEGDRLIITVVNAISGVIRTTDTFARLGGDEFMIILRSCPYKHAQNTVEKIHRKLNEISHSGEYEYELSVSIGMIEITPETKCGLDDILMEADRLMYQSKKEKNSRRRE